MNILMMRHNVMIGTSDHCKVKVKVSLCLTEYHAMKTYWGNGGIFPCILNLGTRWR